MAKKETSPELTEEFKKTLAMTNLIDVEVDDELKKYYDMPAYSPFFKKEAIGG